MNKRQYKKQQRLSEELGQILSSQDAKILKYRKTMSYNK